MSPSGADAGKLYKCYPTDTWVLVGGGSGTMSSVGLSGTANQITVTGTSPITTSGSWTLSFPAGGVTLPGTTTGTFTSQEGVQRSEALKRTVARRYS